MIPSIKTLEDVRKVLQKLSASPSLSAHGILLSADLDMRTVTAAGLLGRVATDAAGTVKRVSTAEAQTLVDATATPAASKVVIASAGGKVDGWVSDATAAVKGLVLLSDSNPAANGTAAPGTGTAVSRTDHVHPSSGGNDYSVHLTNTVGLTTTDFTPLVLTYDTETWDTDTMHGGANPERITFTHAGKYLVVCQVAFAANVTGLRHVAITVSATAQGTSSTLAVGDGYDTTVQASALVSVSAGEYATATATQTSGGDLLVYPKFWAIKVLG